MLKISVAVRLWAPFSFILLDFFLTLRGDAASYDQYTECPETFVYGQLAVVNCTYNSTKALARRDPSFAHGIGNCSYRTQEPLFFRFDGTPRFKNCFGFHPVESECTGNNDRTKNKTMFPQCNCAGKSGDIYIFQYLFYPELYHSGETITCFLPCKDTVTKQDVFTSGAADTCTNIQVDPGVLSMLNCPDYLTLEVNGSMSYTVNLEDHVSTDSRVTLSYAPAEHEVVTVGPNTVGKTPVRVTAKDKFGFQLQCAFIVDVKPNKCLESFISSGLKNATKSCTETGGDLSCTVSCSKGFVFQSGETSMSFSCIGANEWSPSLPVEACVEVTVVVPEYTYEVMVGYAGVIEIFKCDIEARLREHIPTQRIFCFYKLSNGTDIPMTFRVTNVEFFGINLDYLSANVSMVVNSDPPPALKADYDACGLRMKVPANIEEMFNLTGVNCSGVSDPPKFHLTGTQLVNNGKSCGTGMTQTKVDNVDKCVQCAPGNFYRKSKVSCEACPDGQYQSEAGQPQCKACSDGGQYSAQPRSSQDQCIAPCPLGFFNGVGQTQDADVKCIACPVAYYLDTLFAANCKQCPVGTTTSGVEGATDVGSCIVCPKGKYGLLCKSCGQCAGNAYCDKVTGHCSACRTPGLASPLCQVCKRRLRGPDCADCIKPGFKPPDCAECQPGFTAPNCDSCKPGWQFPACDRCRPGFEPPDCAECQADLFPPFCSACRGGFLPPDCKVCRPGLEGTTCETCVKPGFQPPDCRQCKKGFLHPNCTGCANGYYGTECSPCGRCAQRAPCDEEDGSCTACDSPQLTLPLCQVGSSASEKSGLSTGTLLALGLGLGVLLLLVSLGAVHFTRRRSQNNVPGAGGEVPVVAQTGQAQQPSQKQLEVHEHPAFLQQQPTTSVIDDPASIVDGSEMSSASGSQITSASGSETTSASASSFSASSPLKHSSQSSV